MTVSSFSGFESDTGRPGARRDDPLQGVQALVETIRMMLEAGVQSCCLVQLVTVFTKDGKHTVLEGIACDPATDVEQDLADVFRA